MGDGPEDIRGSARERRRQGSKHRHKRRSRKYEKLIHNLVWLAGGLSVSLPLLVLLLYALSRY